MKSSQTTVYELILSTFFLNSFPQIDKYAQLHILTHDGLGTFKLRIMFVPTMLIQRDKVEKLLSMYTPHTTKISHLL